MDTGHTLYSRLERLSRAIETGMGLHYPVSRLDDLHRGIGSAAREFGFSCVDSCVDWLLKTDLSSAQIATLAGHLTIRETYFFRNRRVFEVLEEELLPRIIEAKKGPYRTLRIWSAGCSTGEEPYSIAITLARTIPDLHKWDITILGTDISPSALKKATDGVYGCWSFRDAPAWLTEEWFIKNGPNFEIVPTIRQMVRFTSLNMVSDIYPASHNNTMAMDLIFCRNILMYFSRATADSIVDRLSRCLVEGGWLVANPLEVSFSGESQHLSFVQYPGATFYRKGGNAGNSVIPPLPPAPLRFSTQADPEEPAGHAGVKEQTRTLKKNRLHAAQPKTTDPVSLRDRTRGLADKGHLAEALRVCADALQKDRLHPELHFLQATILQELGRIQEATEALRRALYLDQDSIMAHFALARTLFQLGRHKEAERHLETVQLLLQPYGDGDLVPGSEEMTAGRFRELVSKVQKR